MVDLLQATTSGVFGLIDVAAVTDLAPVYAPVPPRTEPPFIEIGAIDAEETGPKGGGLELHTVEIEFQHRGSSKLPLFAMMAAVRTALDKKVIEAPGASFGEARWVASATDREEDGVTYHGIHRFELLAQADEEEE